MLVPDSSKNPQCWEGYLSYDLVGQKLNVLWDVQFLEEVFTQYSSIMGRECKYPSSVRFWFEIDEETRTSSVPNQHVSSQPLGLLIEEIPAASISSPIIPGQNPSHTADMVDESTDTTFIDIMNNDSVEIMQELVRSGSDLNDCNDGSSQDFLSESLELSSELDTTASSLADGGIQPL